MFEKLTDAGPRRDARLLIMGIRRLREGVTAEAAIRYIRQRCPGTFITLLAEKSLANLFQMHPDVDRVIGCSALGGQMTDAAVREVARRLSSERFDVAVLLRRSDDLIALTQRIRAWNVVCAEPTQPASRANEAVWGLRAAGIAEPNPEHHHGRIVVSKEDERNALTLLGREKGGRSELTIAFHVGSSPLRGVPASPRGKLEKKRKLWPVQNYASLGARLVSELGASLVLIGTRQELARSRRLASLIGRDVLNLCGLTPPRQLAAVLRRCDLLVCGDSGPMHVAPAVGTSVVALYGPTDPQVTEPFAPRRTYSVVSVAIECAPCACREDIECSDNRCMKLINVDDVMMAVALQLDRAKYHRGSKRTR